jgi:glucan biosynthesis protein
MSSMYFTSRTYPTSTNQDFEAETHDSSTLQIMERLIDVALFPP